MRKRRRPTASSLTYFLLGGACLLIAVVIATGVAARMATTGDVRGARHLVPVLILGVPGAVLTFRAPVFGVSYGPAGVKYSGLLGARSYAWADIREVRVAVLRGTVYSSDVPELVLASGGTDQLHMLAGHSSGRANKRVKRLVAELEAARTTAS
ncbi:hypothetical protein [Streptomyces sp. CBMA156]|uniref:hypothetical protein n=1 Tax=Streptomyces sp. CBMA156 TaxID=1930280 RepID=UPI001661A182|nr:hypothetical protein [Streptomyces sp. CBMA156]MBD0672720.1 hypothetical protein [Streptomyces sp. CBMA156]